MTGAVVVADNPGLQLLRLNLTMRTEGIKMVEICILHDRCVAVDRVSLRLNEVRKISLPMRFKNAPPREISLYIRYRDAEGFLQRTKKQYVKLIQESN